MSSEAAPQTNEKNHDFAGDQNLICLQRVLKLKDSSVPSASSVGWDDIDTEQFFGVNACRPPDGGPVFASHFVTWDAAHYLFLSEVGYGKGVRSCAFYPLWPLLVRWFSVVTGGSHLLAGLVVANVLSLGAWLVLFRLVADRWGKG